MYDTILVLILITIPGNFAIQFRSSKFKGSFSDLISKPNNDSFISNCLGDCEDNEGKFVECYCKERICFNLYCDFFETSNNGNCEKSRI